MPFSGKVGDTFSLSDAGGGHRYVILTNPNVDGKVVIVNFTSATYWKEWVVTFNPKDNRKLFSKKTTVNFSDARLVSLASLTEYANTMPPDDYVFCDLNHCRKIIAGASKSKFISEEILKELK